MIGILIIARLGSTRLSEKHLISVNGHPFIYHLVSRLGEIVRHQGDPDSCKIVIATSDELQNRQFEQITFPFPVTVFYGSKDNIPQRQLECAKALNFDQIISIDGDDLITSEKAFHSILTALRSGTPLVKTEGLPLGMNLIGYSTAILESSLAALEDQSVLETGWGRVFNPAQMQSIAITDIPNDSRLRFTLDYQDDATFFKAIIEQTGDRFRDATDDTIVSLVMEQELYKLNAALVDNYWENFHAQVDNEKKKSN